MTTKIDKKITGYKVKNEQAAVPKTEVAPAERVGMHEGIQRPYRLQGSTYKVKPAHLDKALYVTINDYIVDGKSHPYEIFFNSKEMEFFAWATSLTRVISAVFRKGGDVLFLIQELKEVFDPKGGYHKKGGLYMPSLVAEIGYVIEEHLQNIGYITKEVDPHLEAFIAAKKEEHGVEGDNYPSYASVCKKCGAKAVVMLDNCATCLCCNDSKCG